MDKYGNMTRKEACYYLGIGENASDEQIKRAYRYKAKLYHPDENPDTDTKEYYIRAQKAYEYLINNPNISVQSVENHTAMHNGNNAAGTNAAMHSGAHVTGNRNMYADMSMYMSGQQYGNLSNARPAKVYSSTAAAKANYRKQKEKEREREKLQKWDEEHKNIKNRRQQEQMYGSRYAEYMSGDEKSKEEEVLEKIRAIWLAETIKRQIEQDREHKEALQRRKLYRAFMQQEIGKEDN